MMAYENNNMNNAPFGDGFDPFENSNNIDGKLTTTNSTTPVGDGYAQYTGYSHPQQMNNFSAMQMPLASQPNFMSNNMNMNQTMGLQPPQMAMINGFQPTTLMNSVILQQPFYQGSFQQQQHLQQQHSFQQQQHLQQQPLHQQYVVPSYISFQNNVGMNAANSKLPLPSFGSTNANVTNAMDPNKPLLASLEPIPIGGKSDRATNEPIKAPSATLSPFLRTNSKSKRLLPLDFQPTGNYVICGNKRKFFESKGNIRFREVCKMFLQEYVQAPTKIEKSAVVTKVMNILREDCPEGAFVSPEGGRWYAVSERTAREKVGTYFRDCLADSYKSSAKNKIARRKIIKKTSSANNSTTNPSETNHADDGSLGSISFYDVDDLTPVPM